jgi:3-hydroxyacyl-CoA dehydrogenase
MTPPVSSRIERGIAIISVDAPPVNVLSTPVRQGIAAQLADCLANEAVDAIVLICAGRTFFAGADISELGKPPDLPTLHEVMRVIEDASKPVVAAIHGNALGGGLETALVCHYRIATATAHLGLPEVHLGLLPGGGGTQRLPRLIGVERALDLMVFGRTLTTQEAATLGIIDRIVGDDALEQEAIAFAREIVDGGARLRRVRDVTHHIDAARARPDLIDAFRREHAALMHGYKAPAHIVDAVEAAVTLPFDEGMAREWALFRELEDSAESAAQRHIFFAEREATKVPGVGRGIKPAVVTSVVVVGPPTEDRGWVMLLQKHGLDVVQSDDWDTALTMGSAQLGTCDLVLEASPQNLPTAQQVDALQAVMRPEALLALATPRALVALAALVDQPGTMLGLTLPTSGSEALEISRGDATTPEAIATALALARKLGKVAITSQASGGLVIERLLAAKAMAIQTLCGDGQDEASIQEALEAFGFPGSTYNPSVFTSDEPARPVLQAMAQEGDRMLAQGMVSRASDIDVAAVLAAGWPAYRGGPMFWASHEQLRTDRNAKEMS